MLFIMADKSELTNRYDLHLVSVATTEDLVSQGKSLVIVARVGDSLRIRIFNDQRERVIDKSESELLHGRGLTNLKILLDSHPLPDASTLSRREKERIISDAISISGYCRWSDDEKQPENSSPDLPSFLSHATTLYIQQTDWCLKHRESVLKQLAVLLGAQLAVVQFAEGGQQLAAAFFLAFSVALALLFTIAGLKSCHRAFEHAMRYACVIKKVVSAMGGGGKVFVSKKAFVPLVDDECLYVKEMIVKDGEEYGIRTTLDHSKFYTTKDNTLRWAQWTIRGLCTACVVVGIGGCWELREAIRSASLWQWFIIAN